MNLLERLNGDGVTLTFAASYFMCSKRLAKCKLIELGAVESKTTRPIMWRIPNQERARKVLDRFNHPVEAQGWR